MKRKPLLIRADDYTNKAVPHSLIPKARPLPSYPNGNCACNRCCARRAWLTRAECYMTWLIVITGMQRGREGPMGPPGVQGPASR